MQLLVSIHVQLMESQDFGSLFFFCFALLCFWLSDLQENIDESHDEGDLSFVFVLFFLACEIDQEGRRQYFVLIQSCIYSSKKSELPYFYVCQPEVVKQAFLSFKAKP